jgi:uncharacterized delta-60 repeat protein
MEKQILIAVKSLEKKVVDIYSKIKNTGSSPEQLTSKAIIYNADGPFDIKDGFGNVGTQHFLRHIIPLPNGKMIIYGPFIKYQGVVVNGIARLNSDFTLDTTYNGGGSRFYTPGTGQTGLNMISMNATVIPVLDSNQNLYMIAENAYTYNGYSPLGGYRTNKIFKVDSLGNYDEAFSLAVGTGPNDTTHNILVLPDNSIVLTGLFTSFNGTSYNRIIRLNSNGTLNTSFITNMGTGFLGGSVLQTVLTPAGKLLCLGNFTSYNGVARNRIVQLNIDGTIDSSFNYAGGFSGSLGFGTPRVAIDSTTGNIYISDQNSYIYDGLTISKKLIRLTSTGNYDASFSIPAGSMAVTGGIWWVMYFDTVLNKLYFGGGWNYGTECNNYLIRINLDGSLDTTYPLTPGEGLVAIMNYIKPIGTEYLYISYTSPNGDWGDMPWTLHRGFTVINKFTGRLATKFTKTLNY